MTDKYEKHIKVAVHIPAWNDYQLAINQALTLRQQEKSWNESTSNLFQIDVLIQISIHTAIIPTENRNQISDLADSVLEIQGHLDADTNIALGSIFAKQTIPDYFWILSTNDCVHPDLLKNLIHTIIQHPEASLIAADDLNLTRELVITDIMTNLDIGIPFGLISACIYKYEYFSEFLFLWPRFSFTGWGQLALLQFSVNEQEIMNLVTIPTRCFYERSLLEQQNQIESIYMSRVNYFHSFFGFPILVVAVYGTDTVKIRKVLRKWLFKNWYLINFYILKPQQKYTDRWLISMAKKSVSSTGILNHIIFTFAYLIPCVTFYKKYVILKNRISNYNNE